MGTNGRSEDYFVDPWNVFDYCLVVFSVADLASGLSSAKVAGLQLFLKAFTQWGLEIALFSMANLALHS